MHDTHGVPHLTARFALLAPDAMASTSSLQESSSTTATAPATSAPTTSTSLPTGYDTAPAFPSQITPSSTTGAASATPSGSGSGSGTSGVANYYFVFIALIICVGGFAVILFWRRRRRMLSRIDNVRPESHRRHGGGGGWDAAGARRQPWQNRWRPAELSREEGLDEHGEAPPPYMPKTNEEARQRSGNVEEDGEMLPDAEGGPAVPLRTLAREETGLKPPDYEDTARPPQHGHFDPTPSDPSSSRQAP